MGKRKYILAAIISTLMWGFFSIPLRNIKHYPADQILLYRIFTSLIFSWLYILLFRQKQLLSDVRYLKSLDKPKQRKLYLLIICAGILITGNWFSFIYAVNNVSLQSAAFAYMVCPLITALGGFTILKENLSKLKLAAIAIAFISILLLSKGSITHVLWSVFIATLYAFYLIIQKAVIDLDKFNMLGVQLIISALLSIPIYLSNPGLIITDGYFWVNIIIIAVLFTIIPLFLSLYALIGIPSSTLGVIIYLNPIVSFGVAFFYFDETISKYQLAAYTLLLSAVILFNWVLLQSLTKRFYTPSIKPL